MDLLKKVPVRHNICSVELAFNGNVLPSDIPDWQQFYNSFTVATDFSKTYVGLGTVNFNEESQDSNAGTFYKQTVSIRFPNCDANRSERMRLIQNVRFIKLKLTSGRDIIIGRNDIKQNARPKIKIKSNEQIAEVIFETISMFSAGFVINPDVFGLPAFIPVTLY